jgi:hypothetical protein
MPLSRRRLLLTLPAALALGARGAAASAGMARVAAVAGEGGVALLPDGTASTLAPGLILPAGSRIETRARGLAELSFDDGTRVHAGGATLVSLQGSGAQGTAALTMVGVMVVDRREVPGGGPMTVSGEGFDVTLAGAQVFIESLRAEGAGGGAVFVKEGGAAVLSPVGEILLASGEGVDLAALPDPPAPGAGPGILPEADGGPAPGEEATAGLVPPPAPPPPAAAARWSEERVARAFASVGLTT